MEDNSQNNQNGNDLLIDQKGDDLDDMTGSNLRASSYHPERNENYINDFPILLDMGFEEKMIKKGLM